MIGSGTIALTLEEYRRRNCHLIMPMSPDCSLTSSGEVALNVMTVGIYRTVKLHKEINRYWKELDIAKKEWNHCLSKK